MTIPTATRHPQSFQPYEVKTFVRTLFVPCIILRPPDYLRGMCGPHPANDEKRHRLYIKFW